jgi:hypothetical protein
VTDTHAYCRAVEAHLCRRNDGHLIRVVGPAFELVKGWAEAGIPLAVACSGIDRHVERAARKGPRRRPIRVEFCEADVQDAFQAWTRAVGVSAATASADGAAARRASLAHHVDRVVAQLTALRGSGRAPAALDGMLASTVQALDAQRAASGSARGAAREALIAELARLDTALVAAAAMSLGDGERDDVRRDAEREIAPFKARLTPAQWEASVAAAAGRIVRLRLGLPGVAFD